MELQTSELPRSRPIPTVWELEHLISTAGGGIMLRHVLGFSSVSDFETATEVDATLEQKLNGTLVHKLCHNNQLSPVEEKEFVEQLRSAFVGDSEQIGIQIANTTRRSTSFTIELPDIGMVYSSVSVLLTKAGRFGFMTFTPHTGLSMFDQAYGIIEFVEPEIMAKAIKNDVCSIQALHSALDKIQLKLGMILDVSRCAIPIYVTDGINSVYKVHIVRFFKGHPMFETELISFEMMKEEIAQLSARTYKFPPSVKASNISDHCHNWIHPVCGNRKRPCHTPKSNLTRQSPENEGSCESPSPLAIEVPEKKTATPDRKKRKVFHLPATDAVAEVETLIAVNTSIAEVETPIAEVETPIAEVETPIAEVETPIAEVETPIAEVETPIAEVETPIAVKTPKEKKSKRAKAAKESTPVTAPATPDVVDAMTSTPIGEIDPSPVSGSPTSEDASVTKKSKTRSPKKTEAEKLLAKELMEEKKREAEEKKREAEEKKREAEEKKEAQRLERLAKIEKAKQEKLDKAQKLREEKAAAAEAKRAEKAAASESKKKATAAELKKKLAAEAAAIILAENAELAEKEIKRLEKVSATLQKQHADLVQSPVLEHESAVIMARDNKMPSSSSLSPSSSCSSTSSDDSNDAK